MLFVCSVVRYVHTIRAMRGSVLTGSTRLYDKAAILLNIVEAMNSASQCTIQRFASRHKVNDRMFRSAGLCYFLLQARILKCEHVLLRTFSNLLPDFIMTIVSPALLSSLLHLTFVQ